MNDVEARFEALLAHDGGPMDGWSFAAIGLSGRMSADPLPWSYGAVVIPWLHEATSLLDLGTGGGELLESFGSLPPDTHATEPLPAMRERARQRLERHGVTLHEENPSTGLPFENARFDLVLSRHAAFDAGEVCRVLKPGGRFITQQVGGRDDRELNMLLDAPAAIDYSSWTLDRAVDELQQAGLTVVTRREAFPATRFYDIGALVWYLRAVLWRVAEFSLESSRARLFDLHLLIESQGWLEIGGHRFLIEAVRPEQA